MGNLQQALFKLSKETERQNRLERRQWDLEAENRGRCASNPRANSHTSAPPTPGIPILLHRIF